jgi:hypothetical protein
MNNADTRAKLRPHGILSAACRRCAFLSYCGGIEPELSLFDCFQLCNDQCEVCDNVCPKKSDFYHRMCEIGSFQYHQNIPIRQPEVDLPTYIPMVHHGSKRIKPLNIDVVAISTYQLFHIMAGIYRCIADTPTALRAKYKLNKNTKIILRGTSIDADLERYWSYRRRDKAASNLALLDISGAIGPNFSHFLDVPRTDNLYNRKRQLICLEEFQRAGISPVPHLNAVTFADWEFWRDYLKQNKGIHYVSVEFQTGNKNNTQGLIVINRLAWLQEQLGRQLHPIVIGAARFIETIMEKFSRFSLIDSRPFMASVMRKMIVVDPDNHRKVHFLTNHTRPTEPIDRLLLHNIEQYSSWIRNLCHVRRSTCREAS